MLEIVQSTHEEQAIVWAAGAAHWGLATGVENYVLREMSHRDKPTGRGGRQSYWILTDNEVCLDATVLFTHDG